AAEGGEEEQAAIEAEAVPVGVCGAVDDDPPAVAREADARVVRAGGPVDRLEHAALARAGEHETKARPSRPRPDDPQLHALVRERYPRRGELRRELAAGRRVAREHVVALLRIGREVEELASTVVDGIDQLPPAASDPVARRELAHGGRRDQVVAGGAGLGDRLRER